jgi:23S rRNA (uracil1939-C5)-methyltransferase
VDAVLSVSEPLHYRNKSTYPLGVSQTGQVQAGYYQKGTHHIVNLNQCPIQDQRLNLLLAEVKQDIQQQGWQIYNENRYAGQIRHLALRIGRRTGEILLTLISCDRSLKDLEIQAQEWLERYPNLVGVCLNLNRDRSNTIFGSETYCIAGQPFLTEEFAGLTFQIRPDTFFQVHTEQAEALLQVILEELDLQGNEIFVDAYCGIGTMTLPIATRVQQAIGLEIQPQAIEQAQLNAELNHIENVTFQVGAVEKLLSTLTVQPDIVLLDPPRKGCDPTVLETLRQWHPSRIVYVSCNPATLARDLNLLCAEGAYQIRRIQPVDFFPQTAHVECVVILERVETVRRNVFTEIRD